jgi:hypothetical protein
MGNGTNGIGRGGESSTFLDILGAKAAKDLALDMSMTSSIKKESQTPAPVPIKFK